MDNSSRFTSGDLGSTKSSSLILLFILVRIFSFFGFNFYCHVKFISKRNVCQVLYWYFVNILIIITTMKVI